MNIQNRTDNENYGKHMEHRSYTWSDGTKWRRHSRVFLHVRSINKVLIDQEDEPQARYLQQQNQNTSTLQCRFAITQYDIHMSATVYRTVQYMSMIQKLKRLRKPQINLKVSCIIHNYYFSTFLHKNSRLYLFGTHQIVHKSAANDSQCQAIFIHCIWCCHPV